MALLLAFAPLVAQLRPGYFALDDSDLNERIESDYHHREDWREILPKSDLLSEESAHWFDGLYYITTFYDADEAELNYIKFNIFTKDKKPERATFPVKNQRIILPSGNDHTLSMERLGNYVMLVERDASGAVVNASYSITSKELNNGLFLAPIHFLLGGIYSIEGKKGHPLFGPKMSHYNELTYESDPGIYALKVDVEKHAFYVLYGGGRVSNGDPSDPKWDKMPGGGGAGAIMGPMIWEVKPWVQGLEVTVVHDEPFVSHKPSIPNHALLSRLRGPYENVPGVWAVASVIPLTPQLLSFIPTETLEFMLNEMRARHGEWFPDPDVQMVFNSQPWYKATYEPAKLTAIEDFNTSAIKAELSRR